MSGRADAAYHLRELEVARDPASPAHLLPIITADDRRLLDVGCGAGQTLIAAGVGASRTMVGLDVDLAALALGRRLTADIQFVAGSAERLPFASASFDLVISRVALPYTDIPRALAEMARVLTPGGRCWLVLHPPSFAWRELKAGVKRFSGRTMAYQLYVLANGVLLALLGRQVTYPLKRTRFESVQTIGGIRRALDRAGFARIDVKLGRLFVVTATRR